MKIILSRKGFDAGIGRVASPILPSGEDDLGQLDKGERGLEIRLWLR